MKSDWIDEIEDVISDVHRTSEDYYKIISQPKDTCPIIDEIILLINDPLIIIRLEEIRIQCKQIRQWGFEWKILAKSVIENYPNKIEEK